MDELYKKLMDHNTGSDTWAHEFNKVAQALGYSAMDENFLSGWFANAMQKGRWDEHRERTISDEQTWFVKQ